MLGQYKTNSYNIAITNTNVSMNSGQFYTFYSCICAKGGFGHIAKNLAYTRTISSLFNRLFSKLKYIYNIVKTVLY